MTTRMLIDACHQEETRVAVIKGNRIEEFDFESAEHKQIKGNIYLAKVTRVEPSLQAAFVDYGGNRHGFLAFSEIHPDYYQIPLEDRESVMEEVARLVEEEKAMFAGDSSSDDDHDEDDDDHDDDGADSEHDDDHDDEAAHSRSFAHELADDDNSLVDHDDDPVEPEQITAGEEGGDEDVAAVETDDDGEDSQEASDEDDSDDESSDDSDDDADSDNGKNQKDRKGRASSRNNRNQGRGRGQKPRQHRRRRPRSVDEIRRLNLRRRYKIQDVIHRRQVLLVQVVKEERGNKGAALTSYLSLAGRYCVLMPNSAHGGGISRKISSSTDRKRLKSIISDMKLPTSMGCIIRTAGLSRTKTEIRRDFDYLARLWDEIRDLTLKASAPAIIHSDSDLIKRAIRDIYNRDISEVLVEGQDGYRAAKDFMKLLMPSHARRVKQYSDPVSLFHRYGAEQQLSDMYNPVVQLKSGGYLVINPTEALVSIDINSGRSTKEHGIEATALSTNLEAAREIARQLRLRDMAGLVVIDFIDMEYHSNVRKVERAMRDALKSDRAWIQVGRISGFGLMEMSRQRLRTGVLEASTMTCPHCEGSGLIRTITSSGMYALRLLEEEAVRGKGKYLKLLASKEAALFVLNNKRKEIADIEERYGVSIEITSDRSFDGARMEMSVSRKPKVTVDMPELDNDDDQDDDGQDSQDNRSRNDDDDERRGRKKRRRRSRRGGRNRDRQGNGESSSDDDNEQDNDQQQERNRSSDSSDDDGKPRRKRRRRSRKNDQNNGEDTQSGQNDDQSGDNGDGDDKGSDDEAKSKARKPRRRSPRKSEQADASEKTDSKTDDSTDAVAKSDDKGDTDSEKSEKKPVRKPRSRKPASSKAKETKAEPVKASPTKADNADSKGDAKADESKAPSASDAPVKKESPKAAEKAEKADSPAPSASPASKAEDDNKPKKKGWWQRHFG